jgi:hypothetical protein
MLSGCTTALQITIILIQIFLDTAVNCKDFRVKKFEVGVCSAGIKRQSTKD